MRLAAWILTALALILLTPASALAGGRRTHVVAKGQTLGMIAHRYHVSIAAICHANGLRRRDPIRPKQKLIIPSPDDDDGSKAARARRAHEAREAHEGHSAKLPHSSGLHVLDVPGAPPAYYYTPIGRGRLGLRPVIMYLHGRGGHPASDCQRWAPVARRLGWLVCPSGQEDRGNGARGWNNNWAAGHNVVMATLDALRKKYGHRVQLYGNTLIGFSEGAYVAMNVGVREPRAFNRWLILAADSDYWGAAGLEALQHGRHRLRRVYLITGQHDGVAESTLQVRQWLRKAGVPVHISRPKDMGHEVELERKRPMYRAALVWLARGSAHPRHRVAKHSKHHKGRHR